MSLLHPLDERTESLAGTVRPYFRRNALSLALVIVGVVLLGYVAGEYWGMHRSQQNLQAEWERQAVSISSPSQPASSPAQTVNASGQTVKSLDQTKLPPDRILSRLIIHKINMDAIVVEGTSYKALLDGPGHMEGTALPGEVGNAVITGHRDTFFRHINELVKGDQVQLLRNGRIFTYEVTSKRIVMPQEVSVVKQTPDPQLTLITCYPTYYIGPAPKRLVVFAKLVDGRDGGQQSRSAGQSHGGQ